MTSKLFWKRSCLYLQVVKVLSFFDGERVCNGEHYAEHDQHQSVQPA